MSKYSAVISVDGKDQDIIGAIYDSINTDELFYPDNPVKTTVTKSDSSKVVITSASDNMTHLRANLNSTLRLIQTSHASIVESND